MPHPQLTEYQSLVRKHSLDAPPTSCTQEHQYRIHYFDYQGEGGASFNIWGLTASILIKVSGEGPYTQGPGREALRPKNTDTVLGTSLHPSLSR